MNRKENVVDTLEGKNDIPAFNKKMIEFEEGRHEERPAV